MPLRMVGFSGEKFDNYHNSTSHTLTSIISVIIVIYSLTFLGSPNDASTSRMAFTMADNSCGSREQAWSVPFILWSFVMCFSIIWKAKRTKILSLCLHLALVFNVDS